jgi:hypothetical protein
VACFVNLMSCLDEEREIVRDDAAMGLDCDEKRKLLESALVAVVMSEMNATFSATREIHLSHHTKHKKAVCST